MILYRPAAELPLLTRALYGGEGMHFYPFIAFLTRSVFPSTVLFLQIWGGKKNPQKNPRFPEFLTTCSFIPPWIFLPSQQGGNVGGTRAARGKIQSIPIPPQGHVGSCFPNPLGGCFLIFEIRFISQILNYLSDSRGGISPCIVQTFFMSMCLGSCAKLRVQM